MDARFDDIMHAINPKISPTDEQAAVIVSNAPCILVTAGAGAGKTQTMATRIAYHIAVGNVNPSQVLGLTFTRKAAAELASRVETTLIRLRKRGFVSEQALATYRPTIATYDSFTGSLVKTYGPLVGADPRARLITPAEAHQIMEEIVKETSPDELFIPPETSLDAFADYALKYSSTMLDHRVSLEYLDAFLEQEEMAALHLQSDDRKIDKKEFGSDRIPGLEGKTEAETAKLTMKAFQSWNRDIKSNKSGVMKNFSKRRYLMPIVQRYREYKKDHHLVEFSDQADLGRQILQAVPRLREEFSARYRLVMLDEYQDTSIGQAEFLRAALAGKDDQFRSICAVGDPNQAIYGWRGASAAALEDFARDFGSAAGSVERLELSMSFRNSRSVLTAANTLLRGFEESLPHEYASTQAVLALANPPEAEEGTVRSLRTLTRSDHYRALAYRILDVRREAHEQGRQAEIAVLCRNRSYFEPMSQALDALNIPYEFVGGGTLVEAAEIRTVRALLTVASHYGRDDELTRLISHFAISLTGAKAISRIHRSMRSDEKKSILEHLPAEGADVSSADDLRVDLSITEALERMRSYSAAELAILLDIEAEEARRIAMMIGAIEDIRQHRELSLPALVARAVSVLGLDLAAEARTEGYQRVRTNLESLIRNAGAYQRAHPSATLADFAQYLDMVERFERGGEEEAGEEASSADEEIEVHPGVVQILTIHAAKGLEWADLVVIPEMREGAFAPKADRFENWVTNYSVFPYPLRLDYRHLPQFSINAHPDKYDSVRAYAHYKIAGLRFYHASETLRLTYVAMTRPKKELVMGSYWCDDTTVITQKSFHRPSPLLSIVEEQAKVATLKDTWQAHWPEELRGDISFEEAEAWVEDNIGYVSNAHVVSWPEDLPGSSADPHLGTATEADLRMWAQQAQALDVLAVEPSVESEYFTASDVVAFAHDSEAFLADRLRPLPKKPVITSDIGTGVHNRIAAHFTQAAQLDLDWGEEAAFGPVEEKKIENLMKVFRSLPWAQGEALGIEEQIELKILGHQLRCKFDAVFASPQGEGVIIVDWKTGRKPREPEELHAREYQLQLYRLAWARAHSTSLQKVQACFVYLGEGGAEHYPPMLKEEEILSELEALFALDAHRKA